MEPGGSLQCLREPAIGLPHEPTESSSLTYICFLKTRYSNIHPPNFDVMWFVVALRTLEVPTSNLGPETVYLKVSHGINSVFCLS